MQNPRPVLLARAFPQARFFAIWFAVAFFVAGCGGGSGERENEKGGETTVQMKLRHAGVHGKVCAAAPSVVTEVRLTVSGEGMADLVRSTRVFPNGQAIFDLGLPPGEDRTFYAEELDAQGRVLFTGERSEDIEGDLVVIEMTLTPNGAFGVCLSLQVPPSTTLMTGEQVQFAATVTGTTLGVTYQVLEGGAGGSVAPDGLYTAPDTPGIYHVRVTSVADPSLFETVAVTVLGRRPRFAYVANAGDNTLSIYAVDAQTGLLHPRGYVPTAEAPSALALHPSGRFLYAIHPDAGQISGYAVSESGGLAPLAGSPFDTEAGPVSVSADPSGRFIYLAQDDGGLFAYAVDAQSGALTQVDRVESGLDEAAIVVGPSGRFVYANGINDATLATFSVNDATGALTQIDVVASARVSALAVDRLGRYLYVPARDANTLSIYTLDPETGIPGSGPITTTMTGAASGIVPVLLQPGPVLLQPGDVYLAHPTATNAVSGHRFDGGAATSLGSTSSTGSNPQSVAATPSGDFVYIANRDTHDISIYSHSATSFSTVGTIRTRLHPASLVISTGVADVAFTPTFAYTTDWASDQISIYAINASTGALSLNHTLEDVSKPLFITEAPSGAFAYVANNDVVLAYGISAQSPFLTSVPTDAFDDIFPLTLAVEPSGRFAYVVDQDAILVYEVGADGGMLQIDGLDVISGGDPIIAIGADPTGRFLHAVTDGGDVLVYQIDSDSGELTSVLPPAALAGGNLVSVGEDPSGRFVYVVDQGTNAVITYRVDAATGALTLVQNEPTVGGGDPETVVVHPSGRFAYVTVSGASNTQPGALVAYTINAATGALALVGPVPTGIEPRSLDIDVSGRFAYVANEVSNTVSVYGIHPTTGALTPLGTPIATGTTPLSIAAVGTIQ